MQDCRLFTIKLNKMESEKSGKRPRDFYGNKLKTGLYLASDGIIYSVKLSDDKKNFSAESYEGTISGIEDKLIMLIDPIDNLSFAISRLSELEKAALKKKMDQLHI